MTALNISKRKIFKRRRDGQVAQGATVSSVSVSTASSGGVDPVALQDYAKKVDVHAPSQKAFLDALSINSNYIKYNALGVSVENADKLAGVVAGNYTRKDIANIYGANQTINADLYVNGNIIQNGAAYVTHAENVEVESNLMQLNIGEPGSQITGVIPGTAIAFSGIEINRGSADPYYMGIVEGANPLIKLGKANSLVTVAARADSIADNYMLKWDNTAKKIVQERLVSDYWHKDNSNLSTVDWNAKNIIASGTGTFGGGYLFVRKDAIDRLYLGTQEQAYGSGDGVVLASYNKDIIISPNSNKIFTVLGNGTGTKTVGNSESGTFRNTVTNTDYNHIVRTGTGAALYVSNGALSGDFGIARFTKGSTTPGVGTVVFDINNTGTTTEGIAKFNGTAESYLTYISGITGQGWRITNEADGELSNLDIRHGLTCNTFTNNKINISNGDLIVSDSDVADIVVGNYLYFENDQPFQVGDWVVCQGSSIPGNIKYYKGQVVQVGTSVTYVGYDYILIASKTGTGVPAVGDVVVRWDSSVSGRRGLLYLSSSSTNAPFYDVVYGGVTRTRYGSLSGISGQTGYGIWGSTNGTDNNFVISSDGYAKIAGWDFNTTTISKTISTHTVSMGGIPESSIIGFHVKSGSSPLSRVSIGTNGSAWGLFGTVGNAEIFSLGTNNQIAGWNFTANSLASSTSKVMAHRTNGFTVSNAAIYEENVFANSNRVNMYYFSDSDWGLIGKKDGDTMFRLGSINEIAGWNFNNYSISKASVVGGTVNIGMSTSTTESPDGANRLRAGFQIYKDGSDPGIKIMRMGWIDAKDGTNAWTSPSWGVQIGGYFDGTTTYKDIFRVDETGAIIAGWNLRSDAIYTGTYQASNAFTTSGITVHKDGAIRAKNFRIDTDGSVFATNVDISGKISATISGLQTTILDGGNIYESAENYDTGLLSINVIGYASGMTKYRSTEIGNGKGSTMLLCRGVDDEVSIKAGKFTVNNALKVDGVATLNNGLILAGSAIVTGGVSVTTNFIENGVLLSNKYASKSYETYLDKAVLDTTLSTYSSLYGYRYLSTHGWCRLPNGMIMNWGKESVASNSISNTIYYKKAFTEPPCTFSLTPIDTDLGNYDGWAITNETELFFKITNAGAAKSYYWIAIGY